MVLDKSSSPSGAEAVNHAIGTYPLVFLDDISPLPTFESHSQPLEI